MSIESTWEALQQGSSWKLLFAIICHGEAEEVTEDYEIEDLAVVKFKWESVKCEKKMKIICSFSAKKNELAKDSAIKMFMNCDELKYSKQLFCHGHETWSNWEVIGELDNPFTLKPANTYYEILVTNFTAWRLEPDRFSKLYEDTVFTDFNLTTPEGSVAVHKACIATYSDMFKTMLCGAWKETAEGEIMMEGVTLQTLKHLKEYMYLGTIPDNGLRPLLLIAKRYLIEDLEEQCIRKLAQTVTPKNLFSLIKFACENNIPELAFAIPRLTKDSIISEAHNIRERKYMPRAEVKTANE